MNVYYYCLFVLFAIIAFLMIIDDNVSQFFILVYEWLEMNLRKTYYMVKLHPWNFITSWSIRYRSHKMARELLTKINSEVRE